jgi:L-threonate 2-dehydrogenase
LHRTARLLVQPPQSLNSHRNGLVLVTKKSDMSVGMIGLGIMGSAMSRNLIKAGFSVTGFDILPKAVERFVAGGGKAAKSVGEVGSSADILITSLPSASALFKAVGELQALPRGHLVVAETSTFTLEDKSAAQAQLAQAGIVMLDCPLSGSGVQALERDVLVYGSGPKDAYDRCLPVFNGFSRAPHYLGAFGNGSKMKYVANLMVAVHTVVAGEAFALARKAGLDPAQMFAVISDGAAGSRALDVRGEMLIADTYLPIRTMPLELWRKDMRVIADFASSLACPTPMFSAAVPLFNAAVASGYGDQDTAAVAAVIEIMAGLPAPNKT